MRSRGLRLGLLVLGTLVLGFLFAHDRNYGPINFYFGRYIPLRRIMPGLFAAVVFALFFTAVRYARSGGPRYTRRLIVVWLLGASLSWSVAFAEGMGEEALTGRVWSLAHSEFVHIAMYDDLHGMVRNYDAMAKKRRWRFPRSKPPGALLFYRGVVRVAESPLGAFFQPGAGWKKRQLRHRKYQRGKHAKGLRDEAVRRERVARMIAFLFPLLTFLPIFPIYFLARRLTDDKTATLAALLYAVTPTVTLSILHLDGVLYPLLGIGAAALIVEGAHRDKLELIAGGGALLSLGLFTTFSLLPMAPLILAWPTIAALLDTEESWRDRLKRAGLQSAAALGGLIIVHLLFVLGWGYDPIARFTDSMQFHKDWWHGGGANWKIGAPIQFFIWLGVPFFAALFGQLVRSLHPKRLFEPLSVFLILSVVLIVILDFIGHTRAESQRLWMGWIAFLCLPAAAALLRWSENAPHYFIAVVLALEVVTTFFIKVNYTF